MNNYRASIVFAALLIAISLYFGLRAIADGSRFEIVAINGAVIRIDRRTAMAWRCQEKADGSLFWNYIPETGRGILPEKD